MSHHPPVPMLRGSRVWLRPLERRDLEAYRRGCNDGETGYLAGYPWPLNELSVQTWFERVSQAHGKEGFWFTICRLGEDEFLGTSWLKNLDLVNASAEFAIFIADKSLWGKGYGTEVLEIVVDFGFGNLPLERVYLEVDSENERAMASYRKAGFVVEGIMRHAERRRGAFRDRVLMSLLRAEWEKLERRRSWGWAEEPDAKG